MTSSNDISILFVPPKFDGKSNYEHWRSQMMILFVSQEWLEVVEDGYDEPKGQQTPEEQKNLREWKKKNMKALYCIMQAVEKSILHRIHRAKTSKESWDKLEETYKMESAVQKMKLQYLRL
ncbi:hypothetical protein H6P81_017304 [Aristolochia fimbriata]|uniref:DUF4219 domain-containing protein n=1 Tax=Aristolochia fimbriata TaxID=158543 RepID=A0AAV7DXS8_ARIFI|nr:hypothetical protein H6P81_017304 [Aristolochia fimbriata]